jgi:pilus assembly protein CpaE
MVSKASRIVAVGAKLAIVAERAFPGAAVQTGSVEAVGELVAAAARSDLVLIDSDGASTQSLTDAIHGLSKCSPQPAVVLTGVSIPMTLVRALLKLERSDVLEAPFRPEDLERAAAHLVASAEAAAPTASCMCWGVMGAVGGAGATTLVVELAATLAARKKGERGCVIDLNLADGAAHAYLGVGANMQLGQASLSPDRIDAALIEAFCTPVNPSLDLLAAPRSPHAFDTVSPQAVMRLMDVAAHKYNWIIIDMPRRRSGWTLDVLSGCDEILIVSELSVPALLAARDLAMEIETDLPERSEPGIILNRMSHRLLGPAPTLDEAQKALKRKALGTITSDWESAANAVNLGGPILQHRPRSKIVRDVAGLVNKLLACGGQNHGNGLRSVG